IAELRLPSDLVADPSLLEGCALVVTRRPSAWPSAARRLPLAAPVLHAYRPTAWESRVEHAVRRDGRIVVTSPPVHGSAGFLLAPAPGETLDVTLRSQRLAIPGVLRRVEDLERFVRAQSRYTVGGVLGPPDLIATGEFLTSNR